MFIFCLIASVIFLIYISFLILLLISGRKERLWKGEYEPPVSVIIPFRNEEENLARLLNCLLNQFYPKEKIEIIFIDDHSSDQSKFVIEKIQIRQEGYRIKLLSVKQHKGKKAALYTGINAATSEIILQTDADCSMDANWIRNSVRPLKDPMIKVSAGMVRMEAGGRFLQKLFSLEFMSLQASGRALMKRNLPVMANGANLTYRKSIWLQYHSSEGRWLSGDDVFFIQLLAKQDPQSIIYNENSQVNTPAAGSLKEFFSQRIRWGSKTENYPLKQAKWIAWLVAIHNVLLLISAGLAFVNYPVFIWFLWVLLLKSVPEFILLYKFARMSGQTALLFLFFPAAFLYPLYIFLAGVIIILVPAKTRWKGRSIVNQP